MSYNVLGTVLYCSLSNSPQAPYERGMLIILIPICIGKGNYSRSQSLSEAGQCSRLIRLIPKSSLFTLQHPDPHLTLGSLVLASFLSFELASYPPIRHTFYFFYLWVCLKYEHSSLHFRYQKPSPIHLHRSPDWTHHECPHTHWDWPPIQDLHYDQTKP